MTNTEDSNATQSSGSTPSGGGFKASLVRHVLPRMRLTALERLRQVDLNFNQSVRDFRATVSDREQELNSYREIVADNVRSIQAYERVVADYERSLRSFETTLTERERDIGTYQQIVADNERSIDTYQSAMLDYQRQLQECRTALSEHEQQIREYQEIVAANERAIHSYELTLTDQAGRLQSLQSLDRLQQTIAADMETAAELATIQSRSLMRIQSELAGISQLTADLAARSYVNRGIDELGEGGAELLNYALSDNGFAAQAGLRLRWPIHTSFKEGGAEIDNVDVSIVEIPFVLGTLGSLPRHSEILDCGAAHNFLPLSLASAGHRVIVLDQHTYPVEHPCLTSITSVQEWPGPDQPLNAVIWLWPGAQAPPRASLGIDQETLARFRTWLRPDGLLILSVPLPASVDGKHPTDDAACVEALLHGWRIQERRLALSTQPLQWSLVDATSNHHATGPATRSRLLLQATPE